MAALIYIHGFLSSPQSHKAVVTANWLQQYRPDITFLCPFLSPYPGEVQSQLEQLVESLASDDVYLMGSSLGGYWATWLAEKYNLRALLINPAVKPSMLMPELLHVPLPNYHTDDVYTLTESHVAEIRAVDIPVPKRKPNYWLMVQTGDETLDYRLAVDKYQGCKQLVEAGGDHGFQNFERWLPAAIAFLEGKC